MFKKLRSRLVLINMSITTVIIVVVFAAIYLFATHSANQRKPVFEKNIEFDMENIVQFSVENERKAAANDLLSMLILSGITLEVMVFLVSYLLADEAIKPVKESFETQKVFIANASHEIKTPLAAISANLEAADIQDNKWIKNVETETEKLTKLNTELLNLARIDLIDKVSKEEVDIHKTTEEIIESFESRLNGIDFVKEISGNEKISISKQDYIQLVGILLDNAIKYSDKKIKLILDGRELRISNDGATIPKKNLEHIFERFYQVDKSTDGVGLGLSMAKAIAERNNWKIEVKSENENTEFKITL